VEAHGDWNDLGPAVAAAAERHELAVVASSSPEPGVQRVELRGVRSEHVVVVARRGEVDVGRPGPIELTGSWGRFPESAEARDRLVSLLGSIADRLGQLEGVGSAPIDWTSPGP
jgi:hypothetical protein